METLLHNLSEVFAVSIIHSLWQCLLIYLLLRILMADVIRFSAAARYKITLTAMFAATSWFVYTLFDEAGNYSWQLVNHAAVDDMHLPLITAIKQITHADERYEIAIERYLPFISAVYVIGLAFHTLRLASAWFQIRQLKQNITTDSTLQHRLNGLMDLLNIKRQVIVSYTGRIDIPCITGYLKPIILLPLTLSTYLSANEVEAILLHELAHVKRNDYLFNVLQQIMSVILFFNPFVLLMNQMINQERENSCDDMVVALTGQPLVYAQALLKIEQNNVKHLPLALAATGKKYQLLNRIERIMKTKKPMTNIRHLVLALAILVGSISSIAWLNPAIANGKLSVKPIAHNPRSNIDRIVSDSVRSATRPANQHAKPVKVHSANKYKVWYDADGTKHVVGYTGKGTFNWGFNDPELERLSDEVTKRGDAVTKYFDSANFKQIQELMEQTGREMQAYYENPDLQKLTATQEKLGRDFQDKWSDNHGTEELGKQMEAAGKDMETYYNSAEFKKMNAELETKYGISHDHNQYNYKDENYQKYQAELRAHIPAEVIAQQDQLKKMGEQMRDFNTPEMKEQARHLQMMGDSMRKAYNNPKVKAQQEEMRKLSAEMRAYQNSPELKHQQQLLKEATEKLRAYTNSPAFKKRTQEWQKSLKAANWNWDESDVNFDAVPSPTPPPAIPPIPAVTPPPARTTPPLPPVAPEKP